MNNTVKDKPSEFDTQANNFVSKYHIGIRITLSNTRNAKWNPSGNHYVITVSKSGQKSLRFDFWGSVNDRQLGNDPSEYDILTCLNMDQSCPDTFYEFCSEYGYDNKLIESKRLFDRCLKFSKKINNFFTKRELKDLSEIS